MQGVVHSTCTGIGAIGTSRLRFDALRFQRRAATFHNVKIVTNCSEQLRLYWSIHHSNSHFTYEITLFHRGDQLIYNLTNV